MGTKEELLEIERIHTEVKFDDKADGKLLRGMGSDCQSSNAVE
jgi:hypothetical protein